MCSLLFSLLLNKNFWGDKLPVSFKFSLLWVASAVRMVGLCVTCFRGCAIIIAGVQDCFLYSRRCSKQLHVTYVILTRMLWSRWMITPMTASHFAGEVNLSTVKNTERGRNGILTQQPVLLTAMLFCNGTAARFLFAARLFLKTMLGHLREPSIPGLQYKFIHLAKWLLELFRYNWHFCPFKCFIIIDMASSNQENSFSPGDV